VTCDSCARRFEQGECVQRYRLRERGGSIVVAKVHSTCAMRFALQLGRHAMIVGRNARAPLAAGTVEAI
jgi:hypothetical protein